MASSKLGLSPPEKGESHAAAKSVTSVRSHLPLHRQERGSVRGSLDQTSTDSLIGDTAADLVKGKPALIAEDAFLRQ
jgi:hypothetical protein